MANLKDVDEICMKCLLDNDEYKRLDDGETVFLVDTIKVTGITTTFIFNKKKIEENKDAINSLIDNIKPDGEPDSPTMISFLSLCYDKNGNQWTGFHSKTEVLMCLGIAIEKLDYFPKDRKLWDSMPGGVPYIDFK